MTDSITEPGLRITIAIDGKVVAEHATSKGAGADEFMRNLSMLAVWEGQQAVYAVHGKDAADRWHGAVVPIWPPDPKVEPAPLYHVLVDLLNGRGEPGSWTWYVRRFDKTVHVVQRDAAGAVVRELIEPRVGHAYRNLIRAHYHGAEDVTRLLASLFATAGIPYMGGDPSAGPEADEAEPRLPRGAAAGEADVLRAVAPLLRGLDAETAQRRVALLAGIPAAATADRAPDDGPKAAKRLARHLDLHPLRALELAAALRVAPPDRVSLLADALEARAHLPPGPGRVGDFDTLTLTRRKPTLEAVQRAWSRNQDVTEAFVRGQHEYELANWRRLYARVGPKRSNNLVRRALGALTFDWQAAREVYSGWDAVHETFRERFKVGSVDEAFRAAVRPWVGTWRCVEVGSTFFGPTNESPVRGTPPRRRPNTPVDLFRLLFLCKPVGLSFDDMYGQGLFGVRSPCGRFGVSFSLWKYRLSGRFYVAKDLAVRTREERGPFRITSGIPGADNGVATKHPDALRFFRMIQRALQRPWMIYSGDNFKV